MTFHCTGAGLLRWAAMPLSRSLPDPPAGFLAGSDVRVELRWMADLWQVPLLAEAVGAASPDLARAIQDLTTVQDPAPARVRRASTALLHYALRAKYRATPFGLFAGTSPIRLGDVCLVPEPSAPMVTARPDARWLSAVVDLLHTDLDVVEHLSVVADPTHRLEDGHVVVPYRPGADHPEQVRAVLTAPLRSLLELAARPRSVVSAVDHLQAVHPLVPRPRILSLVAASVRAGLLHSNLTPSCLDGSPLRHVLEVLGRVGVDPDTTSVARLRQIDELLNEPGGMSDAHAASRRETGARLMMKIADIGTSPLMLDVHDPAPAVIPRRMAEDIAGALDVLVRVSGHPRGSNGWQDFRERFFERFSLGVLVPVLEVVDPVLGLGYPAGFLGSSAPARDSPLGHRDGHLLNRLQGMLVDGGRELVLDEADITALQRIEPGQIWPNVEVTVAVHAPSPAAVERGDYELWIEGMGAAAGVFTGRFLPLTDAGERERAIDVHRSMPTLDGEAVRVQVCSAPLRRRAQNLGRSIQLVPEVLAIGEHSDQATMWLDELAVGATADRLYLVHLPTGRRVEPFMATAVNQQDATDPMARFLVELPRCHAAVLTPYVWGPVVDALPFLPRVRAGRVVLTPARWHVRAEDLTSSGPCLQQDPGEAVQVWRRRWRVPATVAVGGTDRRLRLDLDDPVHRRVLADLISRHSGPLRVQEAPPDDAHGWLGRSGQITLGFTADQPRSPAPERTLGLAPFRADEIRWPGTARTVLLRIATDTARTSEVFAAGLTDLLDEHAEVECWWFTRYRDPGQHLRVRIRLREAGQFGIVAAGIAQWAARARRSRLIGDISWHTDLPETARYGTGEVLDAAEDFFATDSRAALAQDIPGRDPAIKEGLLVAGLLDITHHLITTDDPSRPDADLAALHLWDSESGRGPGARFERRARALAMRLADRPGTENPDLRGIPGGEGVALAWRSRADALAAYRAALRENGHDPRQVLPALLHMHHVRAVGVDADHEEQTQRHVREVAHSLLARRRARTAAPLGRSA